MVAASGLANGQSHGDCGGDSQSQVAGDESKVKGDIAVSTGVGDGWRGEEEVELTKLQVRDLERRTGRRCEILFFSRERRRCGI